MNLYIKGYHDLNQEEILKAVKILIDNGESINLKDKNGNTPLHSYCDYEDKIRFCGKLDWLTLKKEERERMIKYLILNKADLNAVNNKNEKSFDIFIKHINNKNHELYKIFVKMSN